MAKFITIGYGDREGYDRTDPAVRDAAHAHDARLSSAGTEMGMAGKPVQVRNHDGAGVDTEEGPFMRSSLPVAGFAVIEAASSRGSGGHRLANSVRCRSGRCRGLAVGVAAVVTGRSAAHVPASPSQDQCGMRSPSGTSAADRWYWFMVVVVAQAK